MDTTASTTVYFALTEVLLLLECGSCSSEGNDIWLGFHQLKGNFAPQFKLHRPKNLLMSFHKWDPAFLLIHLVVSQNCLASYTDLNELSKCGSGNP